MPSSSRRARKQAVKEARSTERSEFSRRAVDACLAEPLRWGPGPWWDTLPLDFAERPEPFALGALDRLKVGVPAAGDVVLRTAGASLVGGLALPIGYHPLALWRAFQKRDEAVTLALRGADAVFLRPPRGIAITEEVAKRPLFSPPEGECVDLSFESPYVPHDPERRPAYARQRHNRFAHARHFRHKGSPRATVLAIHGFSADLYHFNEWFFSIPWLYRAGFDVLLVTLPFHGRRQEPGSPFSGHGFFANGPQGINEALCQAVFDLRVLTDHLLDGGVPRVGVTGMSLGGLTTSLLASAEERLSFAIPNVPVISLADLVLEWEPIGTFVRTAMFLARKDLRAVRRMLAPSCPLSYEPKLPRERLFLIGGVGDRLAPPKHARLLWEHWGRPALHWFPGSHVVHLDRGEYFRAMRRFLESVGFSP